METKDPLARAIEIFGSQQALADALAIRSPSISGWRQAGRVPAERCAAIEKLTNGQVTRHDLRPDVFGPVVVAAGQTEPTREVA